MIRKCLLLAGALLTLASPAFAQRNEVSLEASVFRGTVGYARQVAPRALAGIEVGFGFPQIDRTLTPGDDDDDGDPDFEEYLHIGLFLRLKPSDRFEVDTGIRGSIADLWPCTASDCWPAPFAGAYVQPMVGGRRLKVGARLTAGWIADSEEGGPESSTFTAGLNPLIVRYSVPW